MFLHVTSRQAVIIQCDGEYDGARVQLCWTFKANAVAHDAMLYRQKCKRTFTLYTKCILILSGSSYLWWNGWNWITLQYEMDLDRYWKQVPMGKWLKLHESAVQTWLCWPSWNTKGHQYLLFLYPTWQFLVQNYSPSCTDMSKFSWSV